MPEGEHILLTSFALVADHTDELEGRFYGLLDARHPKLMDSFGPGSQQRTQMLTQILAAVHDSVHVDEPGWMALQLGALGRAHTDWGVSSEMYAQVCDCLVQALSQMNDIGWSAELEQVWTAQLTQISEMMLTPRR